MKAMILAAGAATGLYPLTYTLPTALVPILNRPAIDHLLDWLSNSGVDEVVINLHYLHRAVSDALSSRVDPALPSIHLTVETELSGTAGGVALARAHFDETFCVVSTDCVTNLNLEEALKFHKTHGGVATVVAFPSKGTTRFGHMDVEESGRVVSFVEKPSQIGAVLPWINSGIYIFEPEIFQQIPDVRPYDFGRHLFPTLLESGTALFAYRPNPEESVYWRDIEEPLTYREIHRDLLSGRTTLGTSSFSPESGIQHGPDCQISPEAHLVAPILMGSNVVVEAGARLEGPLVLGDDVVIGRDAVLSDSVVWSRTVVDAEVRLSASLVGSSCHLQANQCYDGVLLASGARFEKKAISYD